MITTQIKLTEEEDRALETISQHTGKTRVELLREALDQFIAQFQNGDRLLLLQSAKGMWKDRDDLPALEQLRSEWDRFHPNP